MAESVGATFNIKGILNHEIKDAFWSNAVPKLCPKTLKMLWNPLTEHWQYTVFFWVEEFLFLQNG